MMDLRISKFEAGNKRNAIPREGEAIVYIPKEQISQVIKIVEEFNSIFKAEYSKVDKAVALNFKEIKYDGRVLPKNQSTNLLNLLYSIPHGVIAMSQDIPGLVETSTNLAIINTTEKNIVISTSQRSSVESAKTDIVNQVKSVFSLAGAKVEHSDGYPGWKPNLDSKILKISKNTYKNVFGIEPQIKAIHAGLEECTC